jgi:hypothetical protein
VNDASRERFGYFIDPVNLPLEIATIQEVMGLINAYDNAFDWDDPGGSHTRDGPLQKLIEDSGDAVLRHVREKLGSNYDVVDERRL